MTDMPEVSWTEVGFEVITTALGVYCEVWAQRARIRGFIGETPHSCQAHIDRGKREVFLF
jgi:hypothetical protein